MLVGLALGGLALGEPSPPLATIARSPASDLVIGEFPLVRVVDGDTVRVKGLDSSLRLLGIDTEETFKHDKERRAYMKGFAAYAKDVRGASPRPAKFATPLGDEAKRWAEAWFKDVTTVRLERDDPHEIKDRYRRYLAYVRAEKHGKWVNYNVEAVRAGMSPYFPKYGRSRRFDRDFIAAEAEAKAAKRGIWAPGAEAYPDYPEREAWWTARGDFVAKFHDEAARGAQPTAGAQHDTGPLHGADSQQTGNSPRSTGSPRGTGSEHGTGSQHGSGSQRAVMVDLTHDDAVARLEANVGHDVIALGVVGEIERPGDTHRKRGHARKHRGEGRAGDSGVDGSVGDAHADDAHSDDAHADDARSSDARTQPARKNAAHADAAHAEVAHTDAVHADAAHTDVAHTDVAHTDVAHNGEARANATVSNSARGAGVRTGARVADGDDTYEDGWAGDPDRPDESIDESATEVAQPAATSGRPNGTSGAWPADGVSEARPADAGHGKTPTRVILDNHVQLVFFDPDVFAASGISAWKGEWIRVSGKPSLYHGQPEIVIDRIGQLELSPVPGLTKPTGARPTKSRNHERSVPIHAP